MRSDFINLYEISALFVLQFSHKVSHTMTQSHVIDVCNHLVAKLCCNSLTSVSFVHNFATYYVCVVLFMQVLSNNSVQNELENIDTQNLVQRYLQLRDDTKVSSYVTKK